MKVENWPDIPEECSSIEPPGMSFGGSGAMPLNRPLEAVDTADLNTGTAPCS